MHCNQFIYMYLKKTINELMCSMINFHWEQTSFSSLYIKLLIVFTILKNEDFDFDLFNMHLKKMSYHDKSPKKWTFLSRVIVNQLNNYILSTYFKEVFPIFTTEKTQHIKRVVSPHNQCFSSMWHNAFSNIW